MTRLARDRRTHLGRAKWLAMLGAAALMSAGCSFSASIGGDSAQSKAEQLIEGELATELALTDLTANCQEPANEDAGTTFTCTADSESGQIDFLATIGDERVDVVSQNVLTEADVVLFESESINVLNQQNGLNLAPGAIDCPAGPVILGAGSSFVCAGTDPASGAIHDVTVTITDLTTGAFDVQVAPTPRP